VRTRVQREKRPIAFANAEQQRLTRWALTCIGKCMLTARSQAFSLGIHLLLALLLLAAARSIRAPLPPAATVRATPLTLIRPPKTVEDRRGGSNQTALPARHGSPPPTAHRTFIPPSSTPHPQLALPITVAFDIPSDNTAANIGDPFSRFSNGGLGADGVNGIGSHGCCQGIGESQSGPPGIGSVHRGRGVTPPQLVYKVEPEFSEEARRAKHQGRVLLSIEVDDRGSVRNVRVLQRLGLGLDEKAVEAVLRWRFRPALVDGKPVAAEATVQVNFQLL
jgi:periplasmic protein TonB